MVPVILVAMLLAAPAVLAAERAGEVVYLKGKAWIERDGKRIEAVPHAPVFEGDVLATGAASRLRVRFVDGSRMLLGANARARVRRYHAKGVLDTLLELLEGRARFIVEPLTGKGSRYEIETRAAIIAVRGTDVLAQVERGADHVALVEGKVRLAPRTGAGAPLAIRAGEYARIGKAWPARPQPIPEDWLLAFVRDVGPADAGTRRRKKGAPAQAAPPMDAVQERLLERSGAPLVLPR